MKENTKKKVQCNGPKNIFYVSRLPFLYFDKTSNKQYLNFIKAIKKINTHHFFFPKKLFSFTTYFQQRHRTMVF